MDSERAQFFFGTDNPGFDVDDEDELIAFFASELSPAGDDEDDEADDEFDHEAEEAQARAAMCSVIARQVSADDPPEAWRTIQRLRDLGLERDEILRQMSIAVMRQVQLALEADDEGTTAERSVGEHYRSLLETLPLPSASGVADAIDAVVSAEQDLTFPRLTEAVLERLHRVGDELAVVIVDRVIDDDVEQGELAYASGDRVVAPRLITAGIVLTHRLNEFELDMDALSSVGTDLGGFAWRDEVWWQSDTGERHEIEVFSLEPGHVGWHGPEGWLDDFVAGDLLAVRVDDDATVRIGRVDTDPAPDDLLVARVRRAYEADIAEVALPSLCADLVLAVLLEDPTTFDHPRPPFRDLCEHARLELRGGHVAHDGALWREREHLQRVRRVLDNFDDDALAHEVLELLDVSDDPDASPAALRDLLARLHDPEVCWGVLDELVDPDDLDDERVDAARASAERLVATARSNTERMLAHWVSGIVAERAGDVLDADAHFQIAMEADPEWGPLIDRAGWYASARGDARRAAALWRVLEAPDARELATVEASARRTPAKRGRNEPCWCGSRRKLKLCHANTPEPIPLPDRVAWIASKAAGYLVRRGGIAADLDDFARALAGHRAGVVARQTRSGSDGDQRPRQGGGYRPAVDWRDRASTSTAPRGRSTRKRTTGSARTVQNWIGGNDFTPRGASYVPPPPELVGSFMADLVEFANRSDVPAVVQAGIGP